VTADRLFSRLSGRALELRRKFFDASSGIDQTLFAGEGGVRIHGHVAHDDEIFFTFNLFLAGRFHGGLGEKTFTGRDVEEANVVQRGMAFGFHVEKILALTRFVAGIGLVDHVDFATAADHLAVRVTLLRGFNGRNDFHKGTKTPVAPGSVNRIFFFRSAIILCEPRSTVKPPKTGLLVLLHVLRLICQEFPLETDSAENRFPEGIILLALEGARHHRGDYPSMLLQFIFQLPARPS
jgi:hypothetical protein